MRNIVERIALVVGIVVFVALSAVIMIPVVAATWTFGSKERWARLKADLFSK